MTGNSMARLLGELAGCRWTKLLFMNTVRDVAISVYPLNGMDFSPRTIHSLSSTAGEDVDMAEPLEGVRNVEGDDAGQAEIDPERAATDAAITKFMSQLETVQRSEREANSSAADAKQREQLGRKLHEVEVTNAIRDEPIGFDRRYNRYRYGFSMPAWYLAKMSHPYCCMSLLRSRAVSS
jgi:hypothetical protein